MKRLLLLVSCLTLCIFGLLFYTGCQFGKSDNPVGPTSAVNTANSPTSNSVGLANVRFVIGTSANLRLNSLATPTVMMELKLVNIGNTSNPIIYLKKKAVLTQTNASFTAVAEFNSIPALPLVGRLTIGGGYISYDNNQERSWTGALDLAKGQTSTVTLMPEGRKSATDVIVNTIEKLLETPANIATMPFSLTASVASHVATLDLSSLTVYENALSTFVAAEQPISSVSLNKVVSGMYLNDFQLHLPGFPSSSSISTTVNANGSITIEKAVLLSNTNGYLVLEYQGANTYLISDFSSLTFNSLLPSDTLIEVRKRDGTIIASSYSGITSVSLNKKSSVLIAGDAETLIATVLPEDAIDKSVSWQSSNQSIASVDGFGRVVALEAGTVDITVTTTTDNSKTDKCVLTVKPPASISVTSISLNKASSSLIVGEEENLIAIVLPSDATYKTVSWTSSQPSVASVDSSGKVTAISAGSSNITAKTLDGSKIAVCPIDVTTISVDSISLSKTTTTIIIGNTETLATTVLPVNATDKTFTLTTSDSSIATINQDGLITAIASGTTNITATTTDGSKNATCIVTVSPIRVESIALNKSSTTIIVGSTETITASISPANATDKSISWTSSNTSIATIDQEGLITAIASGTTNITATTTDSSKIATCIVTVSPIRVSSINLNKTSLTITIGNTEPLIASILPENASDKTVSWTTSNSAIATVDNSGNVTANSAGIADITVITTDGSRTSICKVTTTSTPTQPADAEFNIPTNYASVAYPKSDTNTAITVTPFASSSEVGMVLMNRGASTANISWNANLGTTPSLRASKFGAKSNGLSPLTKAQKLHLRLREMEQKMPRFDRSENNNIKGSLRADTVGNSRNFYYIATINNQDVDKILTANCIKVVPIAGTSKSVDFYLDSDIASNDPDANTIIDNLATSWASVYTTNRNIFGEEPTGAVNGIDTTNFAILISKKIESAGYFSSTDFYTDANTMAWWGAHSNERKMFYLQYPDDTSDMTRVVDDMTSTMAHEFQHMINFNQKYQKQNLTSATWLNEAMSGYAEYINDFKIRNSRNQSRALQANMFFAAVNGIGLTTWTGAHENYGEVYLFGLWLAQNYAPADGNVRALLSSNKIGKEAVAAFAGEPFDTVFAKFMMALNVNDYTNGGVYGIKGLDLQANYTFGQWADVQLTGPLTTNVTSWSSSPWGTENVVSYSAAYVNFTNGNGNKLNINATLPAGTSLFELKKN